MDFRELSRARFSVRQYADRPVEEEKLRKVLEAGRLAPTACNNQPVRVLVVKGEEALAALRGATPMQYGAPVSLVVCYDVDEVWHNKREEGYDSGEMDASIVCDEMMLQATELGLATLWARGYRAADIAEALDVPENLRVVCMLDLGYAAEGVEPTANHDSRRPLSETVIEL